VRGYVAPVITSDMLARLPLCEIDRIVFYKRDELTTDLICCDVTMQGRICFFHEEASGWCELIAHLAALPGFRTDWYEAVAMPPFDLCETVAFDRG
jgi:hypothetical protein